MAPDFMMKVVGEHAPARGLSVKHPLMHRTRTVDYAIIMAGEIDMMLDDAGHHLGIYHEGGKRIARKSQRPFGTLSEERRQQQLEIAP